MVSDVRALNSIARHLHRRRFEAGALRLDNVKLGFELDQHGNPTESHIHGKGQMLSPCISLVVPESMLAPHPACKLSHMAPAHPIVAAYGSNTLLRLAEQQEANELVAEFMLLANMSVAQLIGRAFPESAMLRRHPTPDERKMGELEVAAQRLVSASSPLASVDWRQSSTAAKTHAAPSHG